MTEKKFKHPHIFRCAGEGCKAHHQFVDSQGGNYVTPGSKFAVDLWTAMSQTLGDAGWTMRHVPIIATTLRLVCPDCTPKYTPMPEEPPAAAEASL